MFFIVLFYKYSSLCGWLHQSKCSVREMNRKGYIQPPWWGASWYNMQNNFFLFCSFRLQLFRKYLFKGLHVPRIVVCIFICGLCVCFAFTLINCHVLMFIFLMMMMMITSHLVRRIPSARLQGTVLRALHVLFYLVFTVHFWNGYFKSLFHLPRPRFKLVKKFHSAEYWQDSRKMVLCWGLPLLGKVNIHLLKCSF